MHLIVYYAICDMMPDVDDVCYLIRFMKKKLYEERCCEEECEYFLF